MSDAFIGEIRLVPYANSNPPQGWLFCNGAIVNIQQYQMLYSLIGTTYGGDAKTTFGLPNLNGRVPMGQGTGMTTPNTIPAGGPALTARTIGQTGGTDLVTLTAAQIPPHDHPFYASTQPNSSQNPSGLFYASDNGGTYKRYVSPVPSPTPTLVTFDETMVSATGANQPHANIMPGMGLRYIICATAGLYPDRP